MKRLLCVFALSLAAVSSSSADTSSIVSRLTGRPVPMNYSPKTPSLANLRCGRGSCMDDSNICCTQGSNAWCCPSGSYCGDGGGCGH
jgi:hypothetical protein